MRRSVTSGDFTPDVDDSHDRHDEYQCNDHSLSIRQITQVGQHQEGHRGQEPRQRLVRYLAEHVAGRGIEGQMKLVVRASLVRGNDRCRRQHDALALPPSAHSLVPSIVA